MATSRPGGRGFAAYIQSRKNLAGSALGLVGLALHFAGQAGPYWPPVVAGLYGIGALAAPPERPPAPDFPAPEEQLSALRADLSALRAYLAEGGVADRLGSLLELLAALLDPTRGGEVLAADPEALHTLSRIVRQDVPEAVDAYLRTRWWNRLTPGAQVPEQQLDRQTALLAGEAAELVAALRDAEARRQLTHTHYLEQRRPPAGQSELAAELPPE